MTVEEDRERAKMQGRIALGAGGASEGARWPAGLLDLSTTAPLGAAVLRRRNGRTTGYGFGATTDAERGAAVVAARAAASSGDLIEVYGNSTIDASIAGDGINWWLADGATITLSSASTASIFDDTSGAMTFFVGGHGRFVRAANGKGHVLLVQNASSVVHFTASYVAALYASGGAIGDAETIYQLNGKVYADVDEYAGGDGSPIYWLGGDGYYRGLKAENTGGEPTIYSHSPATPVGGQFWCEILHIKGPYPLEISSSDNPDGTARSWVTTQLIEHTGTDQGAVTITGQFGYVQAEKIQTNSATNAYTSGLIDIANGAHAYVTAQKFSCTDSSEEIAAIHINGASTIAYLDIDEFDDASGLPLLGAVLVTNGTCFYRGMNMNLASAGNAFTVAGGVLNVGGVKITTQVANKDLVRSAGTLNAGPDLQYDPAKTTGTITEIWPHGFDPT